MKVLDLFSGIGGFSLGFEAAGMETVAFCEIEPYPQKILRQHWSDVPIYEDVKELTYEQLRKDGIGAVDVICGGFPCTDISQVGKQEGVNDETRSGLWSECARLLREIRPKYGVFENVTALLSGDNGRWLQRILWDISKIGYDAEWHCIPSSELGANHHRDRFWLIAYPCRKRLQRRTEARIFTEGRKNWDELVTRCILDFREKRDVEPIIHRVPHGIPKYMDRIKGLGNAITPPIAEVIGRAIVEDNHVREKTKALRTRTA